MIQDIREKGTTDNFTTRTGEGFQQETAQAYEQTNMKNAEHQVSPCLLLWGAEIHIIKMSVIDEKQEAIACIRMAIDNNNLAESHLDALDDEELSDIDQDVDSQHWQFGSREGKKSNLRVMSAELQGEHEEYRRLEERVRDFVAHHLPEEAMRYEDDIYVSHCSIDQIYQEQFIYYISQAQRYKCLSLKYQSKVDWTEMKDILRCNPDFHGHPRFDCVVVHDDAPGLTCARLKGLIRCWLPSGRVLDLALICGFTRSRWKPRTLWKGYRVLDEDGDPSIIMVDYLLRGGLVCPVSEQDGEKAHYFIDTVDPDMFLRENY